jgi:hypothetical protein
MQIDNLTKQDIEWLLNDYNRIRGYGKVNSWIDWHIKAQSLIKGSAEKPSCSCMWATAARVANSMYEQYEQQLKDKLLSYESTIPEQHGSQEVKRGRKKKTEE